MNYSNELFLCDEVPMTLSNEKIISYFEEIKKGNTFYRDKIIVHNIRLVFNCYYRHFSSTFCEDSDIIAVGIVGLIKAVDTFSLSKGIRFSTYATSCIDNEIMIYIRNEKKNLKKINLFDVMASYDDGSINSYLSVINNGEDIESEYLKKEVSFEIERAVSGLNELEKELYDMYFIKNLSQQEIAVILNVSRIQISNRLRRIVEKIKGILIYRGIIDDSLSNVKLKKLVYNK